MLEKTAFRSLLAMHGGLERLVREAHGRSFISGWNTANPYADQYRTGTQADGLEATAYQSYTSDAPLLELVRRMHERFDGVDAPRRRILPGDGSTGLIATTFLWLLRQHVREVYYLPTVHDTFYYFFDLLGLDVRRGSALHPFEPGFTLDLPSHRSVLFVADPTWYVGRPLSADVLDQIRDWQQATGSLVFVDGTWQYMQWDGVRFEASSRLDPDLTVRLVAPTKLLGLNGHRFAYLLVPEHLYDDLADMHENLHGSTSVPNLAFARRAMTVLTSDEHNSRLTEHVAQVFARLVAAGHLSTEIPPSCGVYCFAVPRHGTADCVTMGGEYYELDGYPGYVRINLLGGAELDVLSR